jgi:hypothetical protein
MAAPPKPGLALAFEATVQLESPLAVGATPDGTRRVVPIVGGSFHGPAIRGSVLSGGADWQYDRADGVTVLSAQYLLKCDDGILIQVHNQALRHGPAWVMNKLAAGEAVEAREYYFRGAVQFSAPSGLYDWLNRSVFVCAGSRLSNAVQLSFYRVE